ncbi:metallophosphoesterase family protein [Dyadobacter tibetensis]|uniref:metallophosphoesterase family protein n=1 Tax=Dyadobacter tibetensis TaxID=1211851 RepID=UPI0004721541|nr:metallophosphoesterase family protein [Dyadobacter tibetensis]
MRIAILSDIHANLPALEAVLEDLKSQKPDAIYCLGDLVGYNVWPNQVIALIREHRIATIAGNHDLKVQLPTAPNAACSTEVSNEYAYKLIGDSERNYLQTLPRHIILEFKLKDITLKLAMVHGSLRSVNEYLIEELPEEYLEEMLQTNGVDILCCGHSHIPYHRVLFSQTNAEKTPRHIINAGSIGKPKDGDPRACYTILNLGLQEGSADSDYIKTDFIRVKYDIEKAAKAIEIAWVPPGAILTVLSGPPYVVSEPGACALAYPPIKASTSIIINILGKFFIVLLF